MLRSALLRTAVLLAVLTSLTGALLAAPTPAQAATGTSFTSRVVALVNSARAARGLAPLRQSWCATAYGGGQSTRMAVRRTMFHQSLGPIVGVCRAQWVAENVAWGTYSPDRVVAFWLGSAPHRANILNPRFTHLGVGASRAPGGPVFTSAVFVDLVA